MIPLARLVAVRDSADRSAPLTREYRVDAQDADTALATALRFETPTFPLRSEARP